MIADRFNSSTLDFAARLRRAARRGGILVMEAEDARWFAGRLEEFETSRLDVERLNEVAYRRARGALEAAFAMRAAVRLERAWCATALVIVAAAGRLVG